MLSRSLTARVCTFRRGLRSSRGLLQRASSSPRAGSATRTGHRTKTLGMSTESNGGVKFGPIAIPASQVFHETPSTFALVNLKPVVLGHVLVCPRRVAPKFTELLDEEISDLWRTVAVVQRVIEREYNTTSSTLAIQDGPLAGQTVPHVHVHVLPRKEGDFARNDDIYDELEKWRGEAGSKALDDDRPPRSAEEMAAEANTLRALFRD